MPGPGHLPRLQRRIGGVLRDRCASGAAASARSSPRPAAASRAPPASTRGPGHPADARGDPPRPHGCAARLDAPPGRGEGRPALAALGGAAIGFVDDVPDGGPRQRRRSPGVSSSPSRPPPLRVGGVRPIVVLRSGSGRSSASLLGRPSSRRRSWPSARRRAVARLAGPGCGLDVATAHAQLLPQVGDVGALALGAVGCLDHDRRPGGPDHPDDELRVDRAGREVVVPVAAGVEVVLRAVGVDQVDAPGDRLDPVDDVARAPRRRRGRGRCPGRTRRRIRRSRPTAGPGRRTDGRWRCRRRPCSRSGSASGSRRTPPRRRRSCASCRSPWPGRRTCSGGRRARSGPWRRPWRPRRRARPGTCGSGSGCGCSSSPR